MPGTTKATPGLERKIKQLCEMGVSRAAAKSALRASKGDVAEAGMVVFDDRHTEAPDIPSDEQLNVGSSQSRSGKGNMATRIPTPDQDDDEDENGSQADEMDEIHEEAEAVNEEEGGNDDADDDGEEEEEEEEDYAEEMEGLSEQDGLSEAGDVDHGDGDAYGFIDTNKDRKEVIREVEEPLKTVWVHLDKRGEYPSQSAAKDLVAAEIFGLGRWLSGCPEGTEQQLLFPLYNTLSGDSFAPTKCPHGCGATIAHRESDFFAIPPDFKIYLERLLQVSHTACESCQGYVCLACGEKGERPASTESSGKGKGKRKESNNSVDLSTDAPDILLHCPNMQAVILGVGLLLVERLWEDASGSSTSSDVTSSPSHKKRKVTPSEAGDSDSKMTATTAKTSAQSTSSADFYKKSYHKSGVGYAGNHGRDDDSGIKAALKLQQQKDSKLARLLSIVRIYLPNRDRSGPFKNSDHMPAGQTLAHLRRRFNPIASRLLSNESLSDMSERKELYNEFMRWLEIMSKHENLSGIMGQPIMRVASIEYAERNGNDGQGRVEKIITYEASPGPRELLERILAQVVVAKRVSESAKLREEQQQLAQQEPTDSTKSGAAAASTTVGPRKAQAAQEAQRLVDFCDVIVKAVGKIDNALRQSKRGEDVLKAIHGTSGGSNDSGKAVDVEGDISEVSDEDLKTAYKTWARENKYDTYDWTMPESLNTEADKTLGPSYKHTYSKEARSIQSFPSRNTALMKEHSVLSSALPAGWDSSVFLRVDEDRPDIMKALIIGPDNTPYENGCFIFDILLGPAYNQSPPQVKIVTTLGGKYRLNPNLYAEGKVCLSLLGTWSGPGWVAGKSTLLQVLVSIQAMILWAEPIANEPGFEQDLGTARSKAYNANVRRMVVRIAMLEYLRNPPEGFRDIISKHFKLKARAITKQLDRWFEEDDGKRLFGDSMSAIRSLNYGASSATTDSDIDANGNSQAGGSGSAFAKNVEAVKEILAKLEKGESP